MKSSTPASEAIAAAVTGLSPVIITVRMPMRRSSGEALLHVGLHHVLEMDDAEEPVAVGQPERRAAGAGDAVHRGAEAAAPRRLRPLASRTNRSTASIAPLRSLRPPRSTPDRRVVAENSMKRAPPAVWSGAVEPYFSCTSATIERPSAVSSARLASSAASALRAR